MTPQKVTSCIFSTAPRRKAAARPRRMRWPNAALILYGHTHMPRRRRLADRRLIVNSGSAWACKPTTMSKAVRTGRIGVLT
ncbi:putative phosphodiesterase [Janthinobacterium sp. CG_23.4]|nr:putative phosphodiesterase [Janthinobacterium sp. CG_23.4]